MLLWEVLPFPIESPGGATRNALAPATARPHRLPFDRRCAAVTKMGRRCRGKVRPGREWCVFHDPELIEKRVRSAASPHSRRRRRLSRLPDGYLRKLSNRAAVGEAMDRLYREVRLGLITPKMGEVLFSILTRLLDSGLCDKPASPARPPSGRSKADRIRPRLRELLTEAEWKAWWQAAAEAPDSAPEAHSVRPMIEKRAAS